MCLHHWSKQIESDPLYRPTFHLVIFLCFCIFTVRAVATTVLLFSIVAVFLADRTQVAVELMVRLSSVVVSNGFIVAKRCEIQFRLLLITNRKSHIGFQITFKYLILEHFEEL